MSQLVPVPINPPPGVVVTESNRVAEGRWVLPFDKIRFVHGRPQKIGGNIRVSSTAMSGTPRATLCWQDFVQNGYISCGTFRKLYAFDNALALTDITPIRSTGGPLGANPFSFTNTSNQVVVNHTGHGAVAGDTVYFSGSATATTVSGAVAGNGGVVRLTVGSTTGMTTGDTNVVVASVGGTTEANGTWTITVIDGTHIEIPPTFVHAYTSGGTVSDPFTFGINMNGTVTPLSNPLVIFSIQTANQYTVTAPNNANGTGADGGANVNFSYEINVGTELGSFGLGWGVGPFGLGTWGTARSSSSIFIDPRVWSLDHFGNVLVATYNGGNIWFFDPTQAEPWPRAVATFAGNTVNGAPQGTNRAMFISPERFVFALCDNLVVNVSSQADPTTWAPATNNTAFARTLQHGTKLVDGLAVAPYISLVWSDTAVYLFQYTGSQFLYNSSIAGVDCGLISPNAAISVDGIAYWMGPDNFYLYNGSVTPIPNVQDIRKFVYDAITPGSLFQANAVYIARYHEIWFFYTTAGATNPNAYVIYHVNDQCWSVGNANFYSSVGVTRGVASASHFPAGDTSPYMAGTDGFIYNHDGVTNALDDNGQPLTWTLTLSPYALNEGEQNLDVERILFDFFQQSGNIKCTVNTFDRLSDLAPMDTETETYPAAAGGLTDFRLSGRYLSLSMTCSDAGNYMRMGKPVAWVRGTGKRP